jgi:putative Ca2+/H+ antiporter (TMEM165/GDT1 family)
VFAGALGSLIVMSVLSAALGKFILGLVPKVSSLHPTPPSVAIAALRHICMSVCVEDV